MSYHLHAVHPSAPAASNNDAGIAMPSVVEKSRMQDDTDRSTAINGESQSSAHCVTTGDGLADSATVQPASSPDPPAETEHSRASIALTMASLCLSATLSALDLTIVTTALPAIVGDFASEAGYTWIGGAYILAYTAITPVWGTLADIWGRKPVMLIALAIFLAGSLLCATVKQLDAFIAGRAVQGLGASGMGIMVNVVISDMFSLRDRGLYLAMTSIIWAVASAVGPVLGGVFTSRLNWRWCFWINLPIGAVVFVVLLFFLKIPSPNTPVRAGLKAIDWTGSVLIVGGTLMILLGLNFGGVTEPWSSSTVICLVVFGVVIVCIFVVNEWRLATKPIIPLRLFSTTSTAAAYSVFFCDAYVFMGTAYYLPLYFQSVLGADALTSGLYLLPLIVSSSLSAAFAGVFIQKTGRYLPVMYVSQLILALGVGLFIDLQFEKDLAKLFIFEILAGIGVGLNIEAPIIAAQAAAPVRDTAAVTATMGFVRSMSTAFSVVIGGVAFQNQMNEENPNLVDQLGQQLASQFNGGQASANVGLIETLPGDQQIIVRQAYFSALRTTWIMYVAFAGMASILNLFVRAHHLSSENEAAILGVDRERSVPVSVPVPVGGFTRRGDEEDIHGQDEEPDRSLRLRTVRDAHAQQGGGK